MSSAGVNLQGPTILEAVHLRVEEGGCWETSAGTFLFAAEVVPSPPPRNRRSNRTVPPCKTQRHTARWAMEDDDDDDVCDLVAVGQNFHKVGPVTRVPARALIRANPLFRLETRKRPPHTRRTLVARAV